MENGREHGKGAVAVGRWSLRRNRCAVTFFILTNKRQSRKTHVNDQ